MRMFKLAVVIVASLAITADVHAQVCVGLPSFGTASVHVNFAGEFPDSAAAYAIGVGGGRDNAAFGNIGAGVITYEGLDDKSTYGFLELGYQVPLSRLQLCPVVSGYVGSGPDDDEIGISSSSRGIGGGLAAGLAIGSRALAVVPNAAVRYSFDEVEFEEEGVEPVTESFDGGLVDLGLGIVFRDRISVQPILHIPFGGADDEMSFGIFAAVRFNWRDF